MNVNFGWGSSVVVCLCPPWLAGTAWLGLQTPRRFYLPISYLSCSGRKGWTLAGLLSLSGFTSSRIPSFLNILSRCQENKTENCKVSQSLDPKAVWYCFHCILLATATLETIQNQGEEKQTLSLIGKNNMYI